MIRGGLLVVIVASMAALGGPAWADTIGVAGPGRKLGYGAQMEGGGTQAVADLNGAAVAWPGAEVADDVCRLRVVARVRRSGEQRS